MTIPRNKREKSHPILGDFLALVRGLKNKPISSTSLFIVFHQKTWCEKYSASMRCMRALSFLLYQGETVKANKSLIK